MRKPDPRSTTPKPKPKSSSPTGALSTSKTPLEQKLLHEFEALGGQNGEVAKKMASFVLNVIRQESFSGPLPHPRHLSEYEAITSGAADRIIAMAEREQNHRHHWEDRSLFFDFFYSMAGISFGFLIGIALFISAYLSAEAGHQTVAIGFLAASTVGMVASFIKGREWLLNRKSQSETNDTPRSKLPEKSKSNRK